MCLGGERKYAQAAGAAAAAAAAHEAGPDPRHYSHMFHELEAQMMIHRALLLQRLVHDPFYVAMNVSLAARRWMLRNLASLAEDVDHKYRLNLLQYFEFLGPGEMLKYLHYKNAPAEMVALWKKLHPPPPLRIPSAGLPGPTPLAAPAVCPAPARAVCRPRTRRDDTGDAQPSKKRRN